MTIDKVEFIQRYIGLISDRDLALELHTTIDEIRETKKEFCSLCWHCRNACNENNCEWVRTNIYPQWVEVDYEGRIVECDRYEYDGKIHD